jgi:hypothetical protein
LNYVAGSLATEGRSSSIDADGGIRNVRLNRFAGSFATKGGSSRVDAVPSRPREDQAGSIPTTEVEVSYCMVLLVPSRPGDDQV